MAKERKIPTFTPAQQQQIDAIRENVINNPGGSGPKNPDGPRPGPRPLAPGEDRIFNWSKGGKISSKGKPKPKGRR